MYSIHIHIIAFCAQIRPNQNATKKVSVKVREADTHSNVKARVPGTDRQLSCYQPSYMFICYGSPRAEDQKRDDQDGSMCSLDVGAGRTLTHILIASCSQSPLFVDLS